MSKKISVLIVILIILLVLSVGYIVYERYNQYRQQKEFSAFQQGAQAGYEQAIIQVVQQATTCNQVPLRVGNDTINIIAVNCLQTG